MDDVSPNVSDSKLDSSCVYSRFIGLSFIILAEIEFLVGNFFAIALISRFILNRSLAVYLALSDGVIMFSLKLLSKFEFKIGILGLTSAVFYNYSYYVIFEARFTLKLKEGWRRS